MLDRKLMILVLIGCGAALSGCAVQRAVVANNAQEKIVGYSKEQVLACMGPPATRAAEGSTEVWSYSSGNDHVTAIGTGYARSTGNLDGSRYGNTFSATGSSTTTSFGSATASRRFCTVNVVINEGRVSRLNYSGPTGGIITAGEQCAFAVQNCLQ